MTQQNSPALAPAAPATLDQGVPQQYPLTPVAETAPVVVVIQKELSGAQWVSRFPTSRITDDLISPFRENVDNFIAALSAAGANVDIAATLRPPERAFLMHYCARIAAGQVLPQNVPEREGIDIDWVHRNAQGQIDLERSKQAARAMKSGYQIVYPPALVSRHSTGRAIDMTITGVIGKVVTNGQGQGITVTSATVLYQLGASYGVIKLISDAPHWSDDGH